MLSAQLFEFLYSPGERYWDFLCFDYCGSFAANMGCKQHLFGRKVSLPLGILGVVEDTEVSLQVS